MCDLLAGRMDAVPPGAHDGQVTRSARRATPGCSWRPWLLAELVADHSMDDDIALLVMRLG
jgi:hypothetical protein